MTASWEIKKIERVGGEKREEKRGEEVRGGEGKGGEGRSTFDLLLSQK